MSAFDLPRAERPAPPVRGRARTWWGDARFLLGLLLIAASVAGVWLVVSSARQTRPVVAAAHTIVAGQRIVASDLRTADVALGDAGRAYLAPDDLATDAVATRTVVAGELVPRAAVGSAAETKTTTVVLPSSIDVASSVKTGTTVEVWAASKLDGGTYDTPRILVPDAVVVSVAHDDSMMGGGAASLEVVIPRADVADTLAAVAGGSALSVVPTGGAR